MERLVEMQQLVAVPKVRQVFPEQRVVAVAVEREDFGRSVFVGYH